MYVFTHLCVGAFLGAAWPNPVGAAVAGFASHGLLDAVPHHDYQTPIPAIIDAGFSISALWVLRKMGATSRLTLNPVLIGGLLAALPDLEVGISFTLDKLGQGHKLPLIYPSHSGLSPHRRLPLPQGFWLQIAIMATSILGIYWLGA
ncbi:MAG: hypothetical protein GX986_06125 [Firmicutes bacterium]|nr:hypothetical protein [Bacillota bacterium]